MEMKFISKKKSSLLMAALLTLGTYNVSYAADEESAIEVANNAAENVSTESRIAALEKELSELKASIKSDKAVQEKKEQDKEKKDKEKNDRLKITGKGYIQGEFRKSDTDHFRANTNKISLDIEAIYKINNTWSLDWMQRTVQFAENKGDQTSTNTETLALLGHNVAGGDITIGRFHWNELSAKSVGDTWISGIRYEFGSKNYRTSLLVGRSRVGFPQWKNNFNNTEDSALYRSILTTGKIGTVGYGVALRNIADKGESVHMYETYIDTPIARNLNLGWNHFYSSAENTKTGQSGEMYKLNYKKCDHAVKGSFDIYATYFHIPKSVVFDGESPSLADKNTFRVGTDYTFAKNIWLQAYYGWNRNIATDVPGQEMRFKLNFVL